MHLLFINDVSSGVPAMDKWHHDFFRALDTLARSNDDEFGERYEAFVSQVEQAFCDEDQWMEEIDFPALRCHQEQHARVLGALHNTHCQIMGGEIQQGREIVDRVLPEWFTLHASTMDAMLARAMNLSPRGYTLLCAKVQDRPAPAKMPLDFNVTTSDQCSI